MTPNNPMTEGEALAVEAEQYEKAWPIIGKLYLVKIGGVLQHEVYMFDQGDCEPGGSAPPFWSRDGLDHCPEFDPRKDQWIALDAIDAALTAHTAASGGEVWRCFHCDEAFTDQESAAEHFGTKLRHDPACTIDPAEFRRLQDRETDYAEQDAAVHRAMARMETEHRTALEREEIKGYERGLRDSGKCPCAAPPAAVPADALERLVDEAAAFDGWVASTGLRIQPNIVEMMRSAWNVRAALIQKGEQS